MFRESGFFFVVLIGLVLVGFSKTYFLELDESFPLVVHLHVLFLGGWLLLITTQAFFIRAEQRSSHRQLGELSYILAPVIVISGIYLARAQFHQRLGTVGLPDNLEFLWWVVSQFVLFGIFYALAIVNRKVAVRHARYMIIATLLFLSPVLVRIFDLLGSGGWPMSSLFLSFVITDLVLLLLMLADMRGRRSPVPFALGLAAFAVAQLGVKVAAGTPAWRVMAGLLVDV